MLLAVIYFSIHLFTVASVIITTVPSLLGRV